MLHFYNLYYSIDILMIKYNNYDEYYHYIVFDIFLFKTIRRHHVQHLIVRFVTHIGLVKLSQ